MCHVLLSGMFTRNDVFRVGQSHIYIMMYVRHFWQENHQYTVYTCDSGQPCTCAAFMQVVSQMASLPRNM
jgi:hypothetical protein